MKRPYRVRYFLDYQYDKSEEIESPPTSYRRTEQEVPVDEQLFHPDIWIMELSGGVRDISSIMLSLSVHNT